MSTKTSSAPKRRAAAAPKESPIEIVVRRGAMRRFDALKTRTSELPVVVTWDRRTDDRRDRDASADVKRDRRQNERRRTPPFTWDLADFVVVEPGKGQKKSAAAKRKKTAKKS